MLNQECLSTVLVVDDEPLLLHQLCEVVRGLGYRDVRSARSCAQAQEVIDNHPLSVLIVDIGLPDGDGRKLASEALRLNPEVRIILISGFPMAALLLAPEVRETASLLEKPFDFHDLAKLLRGHAPVSHARADK